MRAVIFPLLNWDLQVIQNFLIVAYLSANYKHMRNFFFNVPSDLFRSLYFRACKTLNECQWCTDRTVTWTGPPET
jgi:hypothetical protein